jgi:hypothetical protein
LIVCIVDCKFLFDESMSLYHYKTESNVSYIPRSAGAKSLLSSTKEEEQTILDTESLLKRRVVTYGLGGSSDWRAIMLVPNPQGGTDYTVVSIHE